MKSCEPACLKHPVEGKAGNDHEWEKIGVVYLGCESCDSAILILTLLEYSSFLLLQYIFTRSLLDLFRYFSS